MRVLLALATIQRIRYSARMKSTIIIFVSSLSICSVGQKLTTYGQDVERVYRTRDSTQNFYLALAPRTEPKGLLVILPGFGGPPSDVLTETDLPAKARKDGYFVIIPYLAVETNCSDSLSQSRLGALIPEVITKYKIPRTNFFISGHSIGGNGALLYAENAYRLNNEKIVKPNLVFGVDPPLDMKRLWWSFVYFNKVTFITTAVNETHY